MLKLPLKMNPFNKHATFFVYNVILLQIFTNISLTLFVELHVTYYSLLSIVSGRHDNYAVFFNQKLFLIKLTRDTGGKIYTAAFP